MFKQEKFLEYREFYEEATLEKPAQIYSSSESPYSTGDVKLRKEKSTDRRAL